MTPRTVSSPDRAPPPIVSAASSTCTSKPLRARWIAAARPLGPAPTTTAVVMSAAPPHRSALHRRRRASSRSVGAVRYQMDGKFIIGLRPRLSSQHVLDGNVAFFDQAGLGVDDPIPLLLGMDRLTFEDDHPEVALVELAAPLYRLN